VEKIKRSERVSAMIKILSDTPNRIYTLGYFSELFGAAKSTISEDIDQAQGILDRFKLGRLETVTGAAGGVRYLPLLQPDEMMHFRNELCMRLSDPDRILPGGFLYMVDILCSPVLAGKMGEIMASWYAGQHPDFVITVETKGIPVAFMVARTLNLPLMIARRDARITDGSVVAINYVSGSNRRIQTMSMPKRNIKQGQRALLIDDFMKGGGTAKGMIDMMHEFSVQVVGIGVVVSTAQPEHKMVRDYRSIFTLNNVDEIARRVDIRLTPEIRR
jgi:purine operon repressor